MMLFFFFFKVTNYHTKKSNHPKFFIKIKNKFQKSHPVKIKINYHAQALKNQKEKKKVTTGNVIPPSQKKGKKRGNIAA